MKIMSTTNTIQTSNGPLVIGSSTTIRDIPVTLGELLDLETPEDGYTHVLSYHGEQNTGSTLVRPEDVPTVRALLLGQPDPTWPGNEPDDDLDPAPHDGGLVLCL
jgi:hypothetical protein